MKLDLRLARALGNRGHTLCTEVPPLRWLWLDAMVAVDSFSVARFKRSFRRVLAVHQIQESHLSHDMLAPYLYKRQTKMWDGDA